MDSTAQYYEAKATAGGTHGHPNPTYENVE
jgi:hypothetical protein